jgi:4-hydroxybenzoate polyprenyltransferase
MNADTKRFLQTQMMWIAISLAISLALSFLLPFPLSLVTIIGVFLVMNYCKRRWQMRRIGMMGGGSSTGGFGGLFGAGSGGGGVSYVCIVCGQRFKSGTCPRCGSKMKRANF